MKHLNLSMFVRQLLVRDCMLHKSRVSKKVKTNYIYLIKSSLNEILQIHHSHQSVLLRVLANVMMDWCAFAHMHLQNHTRIHMHTTQLYQKSNFDHFTKHKSLGRWSGFYSFTFTKKKKTKQREKYLVMWAKCMN